MVQIITVLLQGIFGLIKFAMFLLALAVVVLVMLGG